MNDIAHAHYTLGKAAFIEVVDIREVKMLYIRHRLFLFILCCLCIFGCDDVRDGMLKVHITGSEFGRTHGFAAAFPEDPTFHGFGYATTYYCVSRMWWRQHYEDRIYLNLTPFIHEFAHALHMQGGVHLIYPDFDERLRHAFETDVVPSDDGFVYSAHTNGYGSTNWLEYWAELTEDWFMDSPDKLTAFYKGVWKYDQLMLPIMEDLFPTIRLAPLDYLERPVEWDWDPDLILD